MHTHRLITPTWLTEALDAVAPERTDRVRATRTIVVEGPRSWVEDTLRTSQVPKTGDRYECPRGVVVCLQTDVEAAR